MVPMVTIKFVMKLDSFGSGLTSINVIIENNIGFMLDTVSLIEVVALTFSRMIGGYKYSHGANSSGRPRPSSRT